MWPCWTSANASHIQDSLYSQVSWCLFNKYYCQVSIMIYDLVSLLSLSATSLLQHRKAQPCFLPWRSPYNWSGKYHWGCRKITLWTLSKNGKFYVWEQCPPQPTWRRHDEVSISKSQTLECKDGVVLLVHLKTISIWRDCFIQLWNNPSENNP